ncbi:hypothetical protein PROFUN_02734 [Planoprotostelium fungivorum]|uniref:Uncharacterized protein n=1 Tax=Planoprotostelium fungivorum TaxID=1890364 RepID=A0A2P6NXK2_9EUKA|nr:hypothetical protein PROFUN_02734 [Planoprotostelium fungivorum]
MNGKCWDPLREKQCLVQYNTDTCGNIPPTQLSTAVQHQRQSQQHNPQLGLAKKSTTNNDATANLADNSKEVDHHTEGRSVSAATLVSVIKKDSHHSPDTKAHLIFNHHHLHTVHSIHIQTSPLSNNHTKTRRLRQIFVTVTMPEPGVTGLVWLQAVRGCTQPHSTNIIEIPHEVWHLTMVRQIWCNCEKRCFNRSSI